MSSSSEYLVPPGPSWDYAEAFPGAPREGESCKKPRRWCGEEEAGSCRWEGICPESEGSGPSFFAKSVPFFLGGVKISRDRPAKLGVSRRFRAQSAVSGVFWDRPAPPGKNGMVGLFRHIRGCGS